MTVYESVIDAIGDTPLFRLRRITEGIDTPVYAKAEFLSIGGSVKDRAALSMVEAAERNGSLRPGGTIVEGTSGNTGIGLALVGRQRGYRVVVGVPDRSSQEKIDILKAYGAEVIVAKGSVSRQDPEHVHNAVQRLAEEIPGAWLANQYDNPANPDAHRLTTGPEIWRQTEGRITHFVCGVGTGGTISGAGEFLHEVSGGLVAVVGADPETSVYSGGDGSPYYVESIGHYRHPETVEDIWPESFHPAVVDRFERIGDRESLLTARRLAREEGLLAGSSSGTAVAAALRVARESAPTDVIVVLLPDSGRSYLSKTFSDEWLRRWGFLDEPLESSIGGEAAEDTVYSAIGEDTGELVTVDSTLTLGEAVARVSDPERYPRVLVVLARTRRPFGIRAAEVLGALDVAWAVRAMAEGLDARQPVVDHLRPSLPVVGVGEPVSAALDRLEAGHHTGVLLVDGRAVALVRQDQAVPGPAPGPAHVAVG